MSSPRAGGSGASGTDDFGPDQLESARCFRCGLEGELRWSLHPFALVECPQCGQAFMSPRLSEEGRFALYGRADYFDDGVYKSDSATRLQRIWARARLDLIEAAGVPDSRSLYEVGCAYGLFLQHAQRRGFEIGGLEYSPVAASRASDELGVEIDVGEVTSLAASDRYAVVAAWDVVEHTPEPREFLEACVAKLEPGGVLAVSCPYFDSLPARLLGRRWWTLKPHKHIWHFTTAGLRSLLGEVGVEVERIVRNPLRRTNFARLDSLLALARKA
jgi:SAM-dependent methyltransferase